MPWKKLEVQPYTKEAKSYDVYANSFAMNLVLIVNALSHEYPTVSKNKMKRILSKLADLGKNELRTHSKFVFMGAFTITKKTLPATNERQMKVFGKLRTVKAHPCTMKVSGKVAKKLRDAVKAVNDREDAQTLIYESDED